MRYLKRSLLLFFGITLALFILPFVAVYAVFEMIFLD